MVPVNDSDLGEKRWSDAEWKDFELWEKVEARIRIKNLRWILGTVAVFVVLCTVPVVSTEMPRWKTLAVARELALKVNEVRLQASVEHVPYRIRLEQGETLALSVERLKSCSDKEGQVMGQFDLVRSDETGIRMVDKILAQKLGIPGLSDSFCYDPLLGSYSQVQGSSMTGFGLLPDKKMAAPQIEDVVTVLVRGTSASVVF